MEGTNVSLEEILSELFPGSKVNTSADHKSCKIHVDEDDIIKLARFGKKLSVTLKRSGTGITIIIETRKK